MKSISVSEMKEGQVYKMDLLAFYKHPRLKIAGYTAVNPQLDPEKRFPTNEFTLRCYNGYRLHFLGSATSVLSVQSTDVFEVIETPLKARPDFRGAFTGVTQCSSYRTTGWDPEIFAVQANGDLIPAFEFLPSKEDPFLIMDGFVNGLDTNVRVKASAYWDGFQAEFSTIPYSCHGWGFDQLQQGLAAVRDRLRAKFPAGRLTLKNVFEIPEAQLLGYEPKHVALGCDPSMNAYGTDPFQVDNPFDLPYRMAGGHIHLGVGKTTPEVANVHAKFLDFLLTIPTIGMFADIDDPIRRQFYGKAGEYRLPSHGVEYRTLSNAWMGHPAVGNVLMDIARWCTGSIQKRFKISDVGVTEEYIRDVINNTDVKAARKLYADNEQIWHSMLNYYHCDKGSAAFSTMVNQGVEGIIPEYRDVEKNWSLKGGWASHSNSINGGDWGNFCRMKL